MPPRHQLGQTLANVKYILEHEEDFPGVEKFWILNRIVDNSTESELIAALRAHHANIIRIPFLSEQYSQIDFRFEDYPTPGYFWTEDFTVMKRIARQRVIEQIYHDKNLYVMNNNGGRNVAIKLGQYLKYEWILPFDGNSYLASRAWDEIKTAMEESGHNTKYISVPMYRLTDNDRAIDASFHVNATEEPQVIFRRDATELFDESMRYGRRSKVS